MALGKRVFLVGLWITLFIFMSILFLNSIMNDKRESSVIKRMGNIVKEYEDMQTLLLMSEFFGEDASCTVLRDMLENMNKGLWDLGVKIDLYRQAKEEFMKDPFYLEQKREFNRKEVMYFAMSKKMKDMCDVNQTIVSFFYKKKESCPDCDAQSFVLTDIKKDIEKIEKDREIAIFSFDADIDLPSINLLLKAYNITCYPAVVVEDVPYCGLYNKKQMVDVLCSKNVLSIC